MASEGGYRYQSELARRYVAQGQARRREEGHEKGRAEGREVVLIARSQLLEVRFGAIPVEALERFERTDLATLRRWTTAVQTTSSLESLLED